MQSAHRDAQMLPEAICYNINSKIPRCEETQVSSFLGIYSSGKVTKYENILKIPMQIVLGNHVGP